MKCNIKLHLLVAHFPSKLVLFPSPRENASICCNQLWFIHGRHKRVERHGSDDSEHSEGWQVFPINKIKVVPSVQVHLHTGCTAFWSSEAIIAKRFPPRL